MSTNSYNEVLHYLKLDSVYYSRSTMGGRDWGLALPEFEGTSMFHIVTGGWCLLDINGTTIELHTGDLVFISRACGHALKGSETASCEDLFSIPVCRISDQYETLDLMPDVEEKTTLLCGVVRINHPAGEMLLNEMPDLIHVGKDQHMFGDMMGEIVRLLIREASGDYIGGETVITRLADVLVVQAIRSWVDTVGEVDCRWVSALKDRKIGKAMLAIHKSPERNWTIEGLGREVGMSRTAFSNRFHELLGETVLHYLTRWRMHLARMRILNGERVDLDFVESLGYRSESAFRRTFKKTLGVNVSAIRQQKASHVSG